MRYFKLPMNRQTYLSLTNPGRPTSKLDPESEAELPDEPRFKAFRETTHEEVAAKETPKDNGKT
jgi:hypothetical protein